MRVTELNRDQLTQLKQGYYCEKFMDVSCYELDDINNIVSDKCMFEVFEHTDFVEDDFFD